MITSSNTSSHALLMGAPGSFEGRLQKLEIYPLIKTGALGIFDPLPQVFVLANGGKYPQPQCGGEVLLDHHATLLIETQTNAGRSSSDIHILSDVQSFCCSFYGKRGVGPHVVIP